MAAAISGDVTWGMGGPDAVHDEDEIEGKRTLQHGVGTVVSCSALWTVQDDDCRERLQSLCSYASCITKYQTCAIQIDIHVQ